MDNDISIWMAQFKTAFYRILRSHQLIHLDPEIQIVYANPWAWRCTSIDCTNEPYCEASDYFEDVKHELEQQLEAA